MLCCDETVTLIQRVEKAEDDCYTCTVLEGVSWFAKTSVALTADGARPVNTLRVRIPDGVLPEGVRPQTGDVLVRGAVGPVSGPEDWRGREYFVVSAVGDNRRGGLPHWSVSGA